ncbi:MAG TPA: hypothetical protein VLR92_10610, partial [Blastocatellia bacterium]|nr:hypothetical protein [Blastocatellia bacterium]
IPVTWRQIMSNITGIDVRHRERGAISIKNLLALMLVVVAALVVIKVTPVYVDERQVIYKVEDLANKSAVRNSKEDDIKKAIEVIRKEYDLPENSINLVSREAGKVKISVNYQRDIDLLVTTYQWKVDHNAAGKDL